MILLTGASGFVGRAVWESLNKKRPVRIVLRNPPGARFAVGVDAVQASLSPSQDWTKALAGVSVVIHCAARVHVMNDDAPDPLAEFRRVNVDGTLRLARQAAEAGVRRFVFLGSIKVNGEYSLPGQPFTADQYALPVDPYGISKHEAETGLCALGRETGMAVVIIRPPLVYGPGVKANFLAMMRWLWSGIPLPLGGITDNRRSLVYLDNLVDLIDTCVDHPAAANQIFLVSDDEDLSTADLLRRMGRALGRPARLLRVPARLITGGAKLLRRPGIAERLCGSLQVDISKTKQILGWSPPVSVDDGFRTTAKHWVDGKR